MPRDILDGRARLDSVTLPKPGGYRASTRSLGDPAAIEALAALIARAEKPCVLFGQQVWTCRAT